MVVLSTAPPDPAHRLSQHSPIWGPQTSLSAVRKNTHTASSVRRRGAAALAAVAILGAGVAGPLAAVASPAIGYSTASNVVVQRQPAPGRCHAIGAGLYERPDPRCTPGALDPAVTQATIHRTICVSGWTSTVRPPERVTEAEKAESMAAYGDRGAMSGYEYDHFVPLELGGATNASTNLWPEPGASPNPKDAVEDALNAVVCEGRLSLAAAQREIVANWVTLAHALSRGTGAPGTAARCTASAEYSSEYGDYDVDVESNVPDSAVTVTGAGETASWHTDASGDADVYFHAGRSSAGEPVTVRVGAATCTTHL